MSEPIRATVAPGQLADVIVPPPPSWMPQTIGWSILAGVLLLVALILAWRWLHRRRINRYRREALAELGRLRSQLATEADRADALCGMAALLKRVALAAWPRTAVAGLSGKAWASFLVEHGGGKDDVKRIAALVDDVEYRPALAHWSADDANAVADACHQWIRSHRVRV